MSTLKRRSFWFIFTVFVIIVIGFSVRILWGFFYVPVAEEMRILVRDWQSIEFKTDIDIMTPNDPPGTYAFNWTQAGSIEGDSQYVLSHFTKLPESRVEPVEALSITVKDTQIQIVDITKLDVYTTFDPENQQFYMKIFDDNGSFDYKPPFEQIPDGLVNHVIYQSKGPDNLQLTPLSLSEWQNDSLLFVEMLANEPSSFDWDMRRGCNEKIERQYDLVSKRKSQLSVFEKCPNERSFDGIQAAAFAAKTDKEATFRYRPISQYQPSNGLLLRPISYSIRIGDQENVVDPSGSYLIVLQSNSTMLLEGKSPGLDTMFSAHITEPTFQGDEPLVKIVPTTKQVTLSGAIGKLSLGLESVITDELSTISLYYKDWPQFVWQHGVLVDENGNMRFYQYLSEESLMDSVVVNGKEMVLTKWEKLPVELKSTILAAAVSLLPLVITILQARRGSQPAPIHLHGAADQLASTIGAAPSSPQNKSGERKVVELFTLIGVLVLLWQQTRAIFRTTK